jgi:hypothetical protein
VYTTVFLFRIPFDRRGRAGEEEEEEKEVLSILRFLLLLASRFRDPFALFAARVVSRSYR